MNVKVFNRQKTLPIAKASVSAAAKALLKNEDVHCDELYVHFVDSKKIADLHGEFFQDPTPTDCITFPIDTPPKPGKKPHQKGCVLGEIFICPEVAVQYAKKHKIPPLEETTLYLVHGILHLLGYDDIDPTDRKAMRKKEKTCMDYLRNESLMIKANG
jgi:probable rRNA maturation factor